jgi:hypothetical protein
VLGISVSMAAGVNANYGTMTKPLHVGQGARNAILAAQLGGAASAPIRRRSKAAAGFASTFRAGARVAARRRSTISAAASDLGGARLPAPSAIPAAA